MLHSTSRQSILFVAVLFSFVASVFYFLQSKHILLK